MPILIDPSIVTDPPSGIFPITDVAAIFAGLPQQVGTGKDTTYFVPVFGNDQSNRCIFYAVGRWWYFYVSDPNYVFRTSTDGITWSSTTVVVAGTAAKSIGYHYDPVTNKFYYVRATAGANFYYRRGVPQAGGTITWDAGEVTQASTHGTTDRPRICSDSNGFAWVAVETIVAGTPHIEVWTDKTGAMASSLDWASHQAANDCIGLIYAFTSGKMCLLESTILGGSEMYNLEFDGAAWSAERNWGASYMENIRCGGVVIGDTLYFSGSSSVNGYPVTFFSHAYGTAGAPTLTTLSSSNDEISDGQGTLISDGVSTLVAIYGASAAPSCGFRGASLYVRISTNLGATWSAEQLLITGQYIFSNMGVNASSIRPNGKAVLTWGVDTGVNTFNLKSSLLQLGTSGTFTTSTGVEVANDLWLKQKNYQFYQYLTPFTTASTVAVYLHTQTNQTAFCFSITPRKTGNVLMKLNVDVCNNTVGDGATVILHDENGGDLVTKTHTQESVVSNYHNINIAYRYAGTVGTCIIVSIKGMAVTGGTASFIINSFEMEEVDN